jgi:exopolysaccharide production protein ExoQ
MLGNVGFLIVTSSGGAINQSAPSQIKSRPGSGARSTLCEQLSLEWWLISVTFLVLLLILDAGAFAIVAYLACCGLIALRQPLSTARDLVRYWPLFIYPTFCVFSKEWSDAPDVSLKQGLELVATVATTIVIFRRIAGRELMSALLGPTFLVCLACLVFQPSALKSGEALHGFIGSKNYFAFIVQVLLASAITVTSDGTQPRIFRAFAVICLALGLVEIVLARSTGAWLTTIAATVGYFGLRVLSRFSLTKRVVAAVCGLILVAPLVVLHKEVWALADAFREKVLHKTSSLSGRSVLWDFSQSLIAERPVLGHGYSAFWRQGNLDAEGLWQMYGIADRSGINFHNQFIEVNVDLGLVGLCLFVPLLVAIGLASLRRSVVNPSISTAVMASLVVELYARLPVESTLIGPWTIFTVLWFGAAVHAFAPVSSPGLRRTTSPAKWWPSTRQPSPLAVD